MKHHPDILIVGGGIIGLTTAYFLAREGLRIEVIEKGDFGQEASWAGAGILPPGNPASARHPFDLLRAHSAALFPALSSELREQTGIDNGYLCSGGLEFVCEQDHAAEQEWRGEGIQFEAVDAETLQRMEPELAGDLSEAYYLPEMAQLRNPRHIKAMMAACQLRGVELRPGCPAFSWHRQDNRIVGVDTATGKRTAGNYILAAGAWSDPLLHQLGWQPGIHPVRGQIALLRTDRPLLKKILLWGPRYLVPRPDGRILAGSTEEHAGFNRHPTAQGIRGLLDLAARLVPALAGAYLERFWAGLRPGSPDGLPILGRVPDVDNLFLAAGHFRAGIQLSPGTALVMKELLLGQKPTVPLQAFALERFQQQERQ